VALVGWQGLRAGQRTASDLYQDHLIAAETTGELRSEIDRAHESALSLLIAAPQDRSRLTTTLVADVVPAVDVTLAEVRKDHAADPVERQATDRIAADWQSFHELLAGGGVASAPPADVAAELTFLFDDATTATGTLIQREDTQAAQAFALGQSNDQHYLRLMLVSLAIALIAGIGMVIWLIRSVLPRTLSYVHFAAEVADGDDSGVLDVRGNDELGDLGRTLRDLARRRHAERAYERTQLEFTNTLQVTADEHEAHDLLKFHVQRSLTRADVTVLNRNNSADRLEAVTPLSTDSSLTRSLEGAQPRSCLAIRFARSHNRSSTIPQLLACSVCEKCPTDTTCTPLLVSGEVIGSVLVEHPSPLSDEEERRIRESVNQSAPVLANLRNLAIAEQRASTDSLTGLPNRRAIQESIKRMVAGASRTVTPLSALMIDLDHFKQVNDTYGHGRGDEVLAGVGVALQASLRASDFAGRWGGEEFILLLSNTTSDGAFNVAEKVRQAIAEIRVSDVDRLIAASVGIATIPEHAGDAEHLVRSADRALYTAKRNGRNRVEIATADALLGPTAGAPVIDLAEAADKSRP
jgi:diguanylate cyclase (GGDEF)-like protein